MKGFMRKALAASCVAAGLASTGCFTGERYRNFIDPCWPERYSSVARQEVVSAFAPQVQNGHILDQTIWNYHFEAGTDKLHPGGMDKLDQIVRTRPEPDPRLFLQTARDIGYEGAVPDKYSDGRRDLDGRRVVAIQKYLAAQTAGRPIAFEVLVHDPADPGISAVSAVTARGAQRANYVGGLSTQGAGGPGTAPSGTYAGQTSPNQPGGPNQPNQPNQPNAPR